nr:uncharacterized protein LOC112281192 [Physcomitrium patens]|eukprot:XP_024373251.1 uncharacterized protein LOC112281192 [Physcomitrella patens]
MTNLELLQKSSKKQIGSFFRNVKPQPLSLFPARSKLGAVPCSLNHVAPISPSRQQALGLDYPSISLHCYLSQRNDALFSRIASGGNCAVVLVNCFPTPEAQYPIPIEEAYAATKWIAENENAIGVDISKLAVCGDSVGGNMSIAVTIIYKEQCLFYPITDVSFNTKSCKEFHDWPWLTLQAMQWFWD